MVFILGFLSSLGVLLPLCSSWVSVASLNLVQLSSPTACFSTAPFPPNLCPSWSPHQPNLLSFGHRGSELAWKGLSFPVYDMGMHPLSCLFCRVVGEFGGLVSGGR